ncbi:hypothetical protein [Glaciibacter psychrotolerans]|uniref:Uncharacterized protein n=1 Tax=Glaciibacter psychrotolerans TaxID=670054 RepID=A0A7Z0EH27_9MICO|nr:hypothetical protein [Leifsonia psychrotolerans]NYJ21420.1 hypothetical protein [Leifsonia psychrotolerans]
MKAPQPPHDGSRPPRRTKRIVIAASVIAVVVAASGLAVVGALNSGNASGASDGASESSTPTPKPAPPLAIPTQTPAPLGDAEASEKTANAAVTDLVQANNEILQRADGGTDGLDSIAAGFVWGEMQALATQRQQEGLKQIGDAKITRTTVSSVDLSASPPTIVFDVCIDTSSIDVVDQNGESLKDQLYSSSTPTLNVYGAQFLDGLWKLVTHDIPATPDGAPCAR